MKTAKEFLNFYGITEGKGELRFDQLEYLLNEFLKVNKSVEDSLLLEKLKKIDKIAREIGGYYTGFGLPLADENQMKKHDKEIKKMIKILKTK